MFYIITARMSKNLPSDPTVDPMDQLAPEERHKRRRESIRESCKRFSRTLTDDEKLHLYRQFIVDDKHRLVWCPVRKAGTTTWQVMMMVLYGRFTNLTNATEFIRTHNGGSAFRYMNRPGKGLTNITDLENKLKNYTKLMVYREPLGRVISCFRQIRLYSSKFRRNTCLKVVKYQEKITGVPNANPDAYKNITYSQFVDYVTMFSKNASMYTSLNNHWRPMNVLCHPCQIDYDYYIDLESSTVTEDSNAVLEAIGAPKWLHITQENRSGNETRQSYFSQLTRTQFLRQLQLYKDDFEIFRYNHPEQTEYSN